MAAIEGYCMKCKAKREITKPQQVITKNGRNMTKGICPVCGTTICKIGASKKSRLSAAETDSKNEATRMCRLVYTIEARPAPVGLCSCAERAVC